MNKTIILNCHYNGLSIIQDLGIHNIDCIAMDSHRSIGTYSKYAKFIKCPNPQNNEKKFINFLYNYCKKEKEKPILFPTNDHWAMAISKYKKKLEQVSIPCVCDYKTIDIILNKKKFNNFIDFKQNIIPKTYNYNEINKINHYPIIAKPNIRRYSSNKINNNYNTLDNLRLKILNNKDELLQYCKINKKVLPNIIFQEFVYGNSNDMYTIGIYAKSGVIKIMFTGHKIRGFPALYGDCIVGESYILPNIIINIATKIIKKLKYTGIAEIEFKKDSKSKKYKLIEINPRSWSWIGITSKMEKSIPYYAYLDLLNIKQKKIISNFKDGEIKYMKIISDFLNCLFRYKEDNPPWKKSFLSWIKEINFKKTIVAEFNAKDYWLFFIIIYKKIFKK
jgi:D-aspartate ligase